MEFPLAMFFCQLPPKIVPIIAFVSLRHSFGNINVPSSQAKLRYRFAVPLRRGTAIFTYTKSRQNV